MRNTIKKIIIILPLLTAAVFLQEELDAKRIADEKIRVPGPLPDGEVLKSLSLGFEEVVADFYWFKAVLYAGNDTGIRDYEYFFSLIDLVTTLDPYFQYPYLFGSIIMSIEADDYEASDKLLMKGFSFHRKSWLFPFGLGFNSYFNHGNLKKAARYLSIAARSPDCPPYLPSLVSRLYHEAGDSDLAIKFLETIIEEAPEGVQREKLEQRLEALRMIQYLERLVARYREDTKEEPRQIRVLVTAGYIEEIPLDPYGGEYYLDGSGRVVSTSKLRPVHLPSRGGES